MEKAVRSVTFQVDHEKMACGIYLPMTEMVGGVPVKTLDIRVCKPYCDPVLTEGEAHTIEHMLATGVRSLECDHIQVLYFGPMGCHTGFYLLLAGNFTDLEALQFLRAGTEKALAMTACPANNRRQCGNCRTLLPTEKVRPVLEKIRALCLACEERKSFDSYTYLEMK